MKRQIKSDASEHHSGSSKSRTEILPLLPGWPSCSWPSCWGGRSGLWSAEDSSDLLLVVGVHPSDASPVSWNSSGFLQLVLFHCQDLLPILWPGVKTKHFIWVSMYLAPSTNWGHYVNAFSWRRDSPPVTCSSEQREGLAVRRAKTVTSLSSYFKTLRSGPASGLNPPSSSRVPKFSLNPVISVVILGILQSRISPQFGFKMSNPGLEIGRVPHPEKRIGDRLPLCSQAKRSADWASAPAASGWNPRPTSAVNRSAYWASPPDPWSNAKIIFGHLVMYCDTAWLDNTNILFMYSVHTDPRLSSFLFYLPRWWTTLSDVNAVLVGSGSIVSVIDRVDCDNILPQGAKKIIFTACHSSKLKLAFTSPDVISTSPKNVFFFCYSNSS